MHDWRASLQRWAQDLAPGHEIRVEPFRVDGETCYVPVTIDGKGHLLRIPFPVDTSFQAIVENISFEIRSLVGGVATSHRAESARWAAEVAPHDHAWESGGSGAQHITPGGYQPPCWRDSGSAA